MMYDTIILGAGAAGLTAALYTSRRALTTLVITQDIGGQAATTPDIENYPGFKHVDGSALTQAMYEQVVAFGARFVFTQAKDITKTDNIFTVKTHNQSHNARTVILAFGLSRRRLGVPGEEAFLGKGVSYCATCDAPLYKDKNVAVVGFGEAANDAALLLSKISRYVYLITKQPSLTGDQSLIQNVRSFDNIAIFTDATVQAIEGDTTVKQLQIIRDNTRQTIAVQGVFIEAGFTIASDFVADLVDLDDREQIKVTRHGETSVPGIFAAGDVTDMPYKQVVISAGEGAKAGLQAYAYINDKNPNTVGIDWGIKK